MDKKEILQKIKDFWTKFWFIVWKDESLKGWIISIIFILVVIRFILFPVLYFITGTTLPLAIVESCSMYHEDNFLSDFDEWWDKNNGKYIDFEITKQDFENFPFTKGFTKGDILFITKPDIKSIQIGDVIIFDSGENHPHPIVHRVVDIREDEKGRLFFTTMGDNNPRAEIFESSIPEERVIGKAHLRIGPYIGWLKLIFFEHKQRPNNKGFC